MKKKFRIIILILMAFIFTITTACDNIEDSGILSLDKTSAVTTVNGGDPILLTANMRLESEFVWESSDEAIATFKVGSMPNTALIAGHTAGNATITVKAGGMTAACEITVKPAQVLAINNPDISLNVGKTATINVETNLSPITYQSNNPSSVSVNSEGLVTGVSVGVATVTIMAGTKQDFCTVTVIKPVISLDKEMIMLSLSDMIPAQLVATVNEEVDSSIVKWVSSDISIATVSGGLVTPVAKGEVKITASNDNVEAVCIVKVKDVILSVVLNETEKTLNCGDTFTMTAEVLPSQIGNDSNVKWSILQSDTALATVDEDTGAIIINSSKIYGKFTIRATSVKDSDAYADCIINVPDPYGDWLAISDKATFDTIMQNPDNVTKSIYLTANVDLEGATYGKLMPFYSGIFDGRGYSISNFTITSLFSEGLKGTVKNFGISCKTQGESNYGIFGLYVDTVGVIQDCIIDVVFDAVDNQSIFGRNNAGTIKNVMATIDNTAGKSVNAGCAQGGRFTSVFYMVKVGGNVNAGGATLKSESDLKKATTFNGWNNSVWNIVDGSLPTLKIQIV